MNEKGFAASGILYPLFIIILGFVVVTLFTLINTKFVFDRVKEDTLAEVMLMRYKLTIK
jgi:hypothetical protein